jgi:hypothetical protein
VVGTICLPMFNQSMDGLFLPTVSEWEAGRSMTTGGDGQLGVQPLDDLYPDVQGSMMSIRPQTWRLSVGSKRRFIHLKRAVIDNHYRECQGAL